MQNMTNVESSLPILLPSQNWQGLQDFYYLFATIDFLFNPSFNPSSVLMYHFMAYINPFLTTHLTSL